jgi:tetratricopeptide (TPR) repeat protein
MKRLLAILWAATAVSVFGCIWDARTLRSEKKAHPDLAHIILNAGKKKPIDPAIREDIKRLRARPEPENVEWINNLAGAYLRVGEPAEAVKLLEPARERFPSDYGVRANLGTAYHLLGRYAEAEREIAKDLEINPDAHFGLEKYHLALLQYLGRDQNYQRRHLYIDELTEPFFTRIGFGMRYSYVEAGLLPADHQPVPREEIEKTKKIPRGGWGKHYPSVQIFEDHAEAEGDIPPSYRFKWNLATDTNLVRGVMYMAELNPDQPAAMVGAGIIATRQKAYHLAVAAYQRAIALGSPQADLLKFHMENLESYIRKSRWHTGAISWTLVATFGIPILGLVLWRRAKRA